MQSEFRINRSSRDMLSLLIDKHSPAQLNAIPFGFSNNLIWNIGHIIVTQQLIVYRNSGLDMMVVMKWCRLIKKERVRKASFQKKALTISASCFIYD